MIVDDERLARQKVRTLLAAHDEIVVAGECVNGAEAVATIRREKPELVFLDVQMPGVDGFEVLRRLRGEVLPVIVFVTAHDEYAVRAFEVDAVDYLLKPFDRKRFNDALRRARRALDGGAADMQASLARLVERLGAREEPKSIEQFVVKAHDRIFLVAAADVDWIEAVGKYVRLHAGKDAHLVREAISDVEQRLDPRRFVRIHRTTIVNLRRVSEMHRGFGGSWFVVLTDGTRLTMSRRHRARIREELGLAL